MGLVKSIVAFVIGFVVLGAIEKIGPQVMSRFVQSRFAMAADARASNAPAPAMNTPRHFARADYMSTETEDARRLAHERMTELMDRQLRSAICGNPACAQPRMR